MNVNTKLLFWVVLISACALTACGFHLRGFVQLPASLHTLKISPDTPFDPFYKILKQSFRQNKTNIVPFHIQDVPTFFIVSKALTEDTLTYAPDGTESRKKLTFEVKYKVLNAKGLPFNAEFNREKSAKSIRTYNVATNTVLEDQTEKKVLEEELQYEVSHQILQQLTMLP